MIVRGRYLPPRAGDAPLGASPAPLRAPRKHGPPMPADALAKLATSDPVEMLGDAIDVVMPTIRRLAWAHTTAIIVYRDRQTGKDGEPREVEPYREWFGSRNTLMLTAWCRKAGGVRHFEVARIVSVTPGAPFRPRGDIQIRQPEDVDAGA